MTTPSNDVPDAEAVLRATLAAQNTQLEQLREVIRAQHDALTEIGKAAYEALDTEEAFTAAPPEIVASLVKEAFSRLLTPALSARMGAIYDAVACAQQRRSEIPPAERGGANAIVDSLLSLIDEIPTPDEPADRGDLPTLPIPRITQMIPMDAAIRGMEQFRETAAREVEQYAPEIRAHQKLAERIRTLPILDLLE